jgi:hypothetical protein
VFVEGSQEFVFFQFYRNFSQEFLWAGIPVGRNSCGQEFLYLLRNPPEFQRIPVPAESCLAQASD